MRNKLNVIGLLLGILVFFLASISFVTGADANYGGVTFVNPLASSTVVGTYVFNITNSSGFSAMANCTIYAQSSLTANSSWVEIAIITNETSIAETPVEVNGTVNSAVIEDANNYEINATCWNITGDIADGTISSVIIDNTVPTAPSSLSPSDLALQTNDTVTFSTTVTNAETTSCVLYFDGINPGATSYSMTYSTNTCSHTISNLPYQSYKWYVRASDESNTTDSVINTINLNSKTNPMGNVLIAKQAGVDVAIGGKGKVFSIQEWITNEKLGPIPVWVISVFIVVSVIAYALFKKK